MLQASHLPAHWISQFGMLLLAIIISILSALLFYRYIERPTHLFAKRIKPKKRGS